MYHVAIDIIAMAIAYLLGSISSSILVCKLLHLPDPRTLGSKNPGATNVLRTGSKLAALFTVAGDILKGIVSVFIAQKLGVSGVALGFVVFFTFLGHAYPLFFGFKGGKGVATSLGCLLVLSWPLAVATAITWLLVLLLSRYSSLAAITVAVLLPFYAFAITDRSYCIALTIMSIFGLWRHRTNIKRLLAGTEDRVNWRRNRS